MLGTLRMSEQATELGKCVESVGPMMRMLESIESIVVDFKRAAPSVRVLVVSGYNGRQAILE